MAVHWCKTVYRPRQWLLQTTQARMASLTGSTEAANKVLVNQSGYLVSHRFSRRLKPASTLLGYGRTAQQVIPDMDTLQAVYRFWCKFAEFGTSFDRLRAVVRCLDKMLYS